jgi:hypothetical protein
MTNPKTPPCPICKTPMLMMWGCGWDYDRWICPVRGCDGEVELETTSYYEGWDGK